MPVRGLSRLYYNWLNFQSFNINTAFMSMQIQIKAEPGISFSFESNPGEIIFISTCYTA